jgi:hypothetical protein
METSNTNPGRDIVLAHTPQPIGCLTSEQYRAMSLDVHHNRKKLAVAFAVNDAALQSAPR